MSYNSASDELFLADYDNKVVRAIRVRDNVGDMCDVYRASEIWSVCHMSDSDTLLVCLSEHTNEPDKNYATWLVALNRISRAPRATSRNCSEWREAHRLQTDG